jgi:hypothetical protein
MTAECGGTTPRNGQQHFDMLPSGSTGPDLRRFYYQLALKKNGSVAAVAVARKLLLRLFCMLRDQIDYDEFRHRGRDARCARGKASSPRDG